MIVCFKFSTSILYVLWLFISQDHDTFQLYAHVIWANVKSTPNYHKFNNTEININIICNKCLLNISDIIIIHTKGWNPNPMGPIFGPTVLRGVLNQSMQWPTPNSLPARSQPPKASPATLRTEMPELMLVLYLHRLVNHNSFAKESDLNYKYPS